MRRSHFVFMAITAVLLSCPLTFADLTASFQGLGDLAGGDFFSMAWGVSDDGSTVVGNSYSGSGNEAFRWTVTDGMVGLGYLSGGSNNSVANAVSADGSVIVGYSSSARTVAAGYYEAFRWENGQMTGLGGLPGGRYSSFATDVSADGSVIVGSARSTKADDGYEAFRWEGSMVGLGVPAGHQTSEAFAVSDDGQTIVGRAGYRHGFIWREGEPTPLNTWPETINVMDPRDISPDGSVIVGHFSSAVPNRNEAFLWKDGEMTALGTRYSYASAVSADGQSVVGSVSVLQCWAYLWTPELGMVNLQSLLEDEYRLDLSGWNLTHATGISADGLTIVGQGFNPYGFQEGWIARLPKPTVVPLPSAALIGVLGLGYSGWRLRRRTS